MAIHHTICFVLVIVLVCNAVLYPTLFSSVLRQWFGWKDPPKKADPVPEFPPHMRGGMPHPARRPEMKSGHEASAYMAQQRQDGGGRGMMGTILPVYAVGIFLYFGYVIYKIFLKEKPTTETRESWAQQASKPAQDMEQYEPTLERQQEEALQKRLSEQLKAENYLPRRAARGSKEDEVEGLKHRLAETEKTMEKMMEMMNNMGMVFNQVTKQMHYNNKPYDAVVTPIATDNQHEDVSENDDHVSNSDGDDEEGENIEETHGLEDLHMTDNEVEGDLEDFILDKGIEELLGVNEDETIGNVRRRNFVTENEDVE